MAHTISFNITDVEYNMSVFVNLDPDKWCKEALRAKLIKVADILIEENTKYRASKLTVQEKVALINQIVGGN